MSCKRCGLKHSGTEDCKVYARRIARERANGETPLDQPVVPVASKAGVDREERLPKNAAPQDTTGERAIEQTNPIASPVGAALIVCPVCEARRLKNLEAVRAYRARKK